MGKRKADSDAEDDFEESASEELELPKSKMQSKKTAKKPKIPDPDDDVDEVPRSKKKKGKADKTSSSGGKVQRGGDGEKFIDLGRKRRASVKEFKGSVYLDIREFYGADGDEKPGKKGITLQQEQWDALKNSIAEIDSLFEGAKK